MKLLTRLKKFIEKRKLIKKIDEDLEEIMENLDLKDQKDPIPFEETQIPSLVPTLTDDELNKIEGLTEQDISTIKAIIAENVE